MSRVKPIKPWTELTVAVTGMNARPDNPGPGYAVARCLREAPEFSGRIVGLGYDALDPGVYDRQVCDQAYLLPYPSSGEADLTCGCRGPRSRRSSRCRCRRPPSGRGSVAVGARGRRTFSN